MKKGTLLLTLIVSIFLCSCGDSPKDNKKEADNQQEKTTEIAAAPEASCPKGYPEELTVPPGFKASEINPGSGSGSQTIIVDGSMSFGPKREFNSYKIWGSMPQNVAEIISHYKKLLTDLGYEGEWKSDEGNEKVQGVFKKDQNELELKISSEQFSFELKVWGQEISEQSEQSDAK